MNTGLNPVIPAHSGDVPDWTALKTDLHCPRCEYNLRTLTIPRCPECGLTFEWRDLLDAERRSAGCPLFEYHWRRRPISSLLRTIWLALQPWRLWAVVRMENTPSVRALVVLALLTLVGSFLLHTLANAFSIYSMRCYTTRFKPGYPGYWETVGYGFYYDNVIPYLQITLLPLVAVFISIVVYQISLRRNRIATGHLVRIAVFSWIGWLVAGLLVEVVQASRWVPVYFRGTPWLESLRLPLYYYVPLAVLFMYVLSLALAFSRYLQLRRSWAAAIASIALATMIIVFLTYTLRDSLLRQRLGNDPTKLLYYWIPGLPDVCRSIFLE